LPNSDATVTTLALAAISASISLFIKVAGTLHLAKVITELLLAVSRHLRQQCLELKAHLPDIRRERKEWRAVFRD
jgi:hypothetical protein